VRIPILTYNSIRIDGNDSRFNDHLALASDLALITDAGFKVVPLAVAVEAWLANRGSELDGKLVCLACEHGTDFDFFDLPHPRWGMQRSLLNILRDFARERPGAQPGLHITSFVIASPDARKTLDSKCMVGRNWWKDDWWRQAIDSGFMHVANNSWDYNHEALPEAFSLGIPRGRFANIDSQHLAEHEIGLAADLLRERVPNPGIQLFAYPYGETNSYLTGAYFPRFGRELGIKAALTGRSGFLEPGTGRWEIPRFVSGRDWSSREELESILESAEDEQRVWVATRQAPITPMVEEPITPGTPSPTLEVTGNPWTGSMDDEGFRGRFKMVPQVISEWVGRHRPLAGLDVLDFGCGEGISALGLVLDHEVGRVVGVDIGPDPERCLPLARAKLGLSTLPANLALHRVSPGYLHRDDDKFDLVYSWSVFEHVDQRLIGRTLKLIKSSLKRDGLFLAQIAPLYYSSEGSHLFHKIPEPWCHLLLQHNTLHERLVAATPDKNEFLTLWGTYRTLNRITAGELVDRIADGGFEILKTWTDRETRRPPGSLMEVYKEDVLTTHQVIVLAAPR
jgi:2-polyprenyl-3-methyl-5-hydroxy-6-metoxy-1,4-benzoquinol methylase